MRIVALFVVFSALFCVCFALSPPSIPTTFHARVSATFSSGGAEYSGAGLYALDLAKGFARTDVHMWSGEANHMNIHTLDRYDVKRTFNYDNKNNKCQQKTVSGSLADPHKWVSKASFSGESEYAGGLIQTWEAQEGNTYYRVSVKKGTNEPVSFSTRQRSTDGKESELVLKVREWSTEASPEWARYIPAICLDENAYGDVPGVVYFANNNWNCYDVACDQTVPAGSGQPNYACAEFVARSLAYGQFIPNIGATDPQSNYYNYNYQGNSYDLCYTTYLSNCLGVLGFQKLAAAYGSVDAGVAVFGDAGDGYFSHAIIGVGPQTIDAHNNARYQIPVQDDMINGVDAAWGCPGSPPSSGSSGSSGSSTGSSSSGSSSSGTYYSAQMEASQQISKLEGGVGSIYNKAPVDSKSDHVRLREEKAEKKFN